MASQGVYQLQLMQGEDNAVHVLVLGGNGDAEMYIKSVEEYV